MDILPVEEALKAVSRLLIAPSGLFYATINYDGLTSILPLYEDQVFEAKLLEVYNRSMDDRFVEGKKTGGSRGGSALFTKAWKLGYEIVGYGSSDWWVTPFPEGYATADERFLEGLLAVIYEEERRHPEIETRRLEAWYEDRLGRLRDQSLSLMVHQTDLLARRPAEK